jgi:hypothetical protein
MADSVNAWGAVALQGARYFEAAAGVRYWEDASVNDTSDDDGTLIPFRKGDDWCPVIDLESGRIVDWPDDCIADIHYKVCDDGEYWLLDADRNRIARRVGYVPGDFLCHGDNGYGDYIILTVNNCGSIADWSRPDIDPDDWLPMDSDERR